MDRNTEKYLLRKGNEIVYIGISYDSVERAQQHQADKEFTRVEKVGIKTTREAAEKWERERLATYRKNHGGRNPKYNKTNHG